MLKTYKGVMTFKLCERTSQIGPLNHELHVLKDGQFCTPGCTPGVQVANLGAPRAETRDVTKCAYSDLVGYDIART